MLTEWLFMPPYNSGGFTFSTAGLIGAGEIKAGRSMILFTRH
jgi:hypothetical protein